MARNARLFRLWDRPGSSGTKPEAGTLAGETRRPAWRTSLRVEGLEARELLTGVITGVATLPAGLTAGPAAVAIDGRLWFAQTDATGLTSLGQLNASGALTKVNLPSSDAHASIHSLTADTSGNVWYTGVNSSTSGATTGVLGKVTSSGTVTDLALSSAALNPGPATIGPDGNLWFAVSRPGQDPAIDRVGPDGTINEYPVKGALSLTWLTTGKDGNLWFVDGTKIGKMTTSGTVTEYTLPVPTDGSPINLTNAQLTAAKSDGNIWFLGLGNAVSRITPSGSVKSFPAPGAQLTSLGTAPDGNIWVGFLAPTTTGVSALLARMTPDGLTTIMPDLANSSGSPVVRTVAGNDGGVWLENGTSAFARLGLASVPTFTAPIITPTTKSSPTITAGQSFSGTIASFTPNRPDGTTTTYTAAINWGDGNTSAGIVVANSSGGYDVTGNNPYPGVPAGSMENVQITVRDASGLMAVIFNRVAVVAPTPTTTSGVVSTPGKPVVAGVTSNSGTTSTSNTPGQTVVSAPSSGTTTVPTTPILSGLSGSNNPTMNPLVNIGPMPGTTLVKGPHGHYRAVHTGVHVHGVRVAHPSKHVAHVAKRKAR